MTTYVFEQVTARRTRKGKCPACGKTTSRSETFTNTVNPWNKNEDGTVRTWAEVKACVEDLADAWVPDFRHNTEACRGEGR